jgi:hypothetical protein
MLLSKNKNNLPNWEWGRSWQQLSLQLQNFFDGVKGQIKRPVTP